jgi:hypothetical protein
LNPDAVFLPASSAFKALGVKKTHYLSSEKAALRSENLGLFA